tara:strand:- start:15 stop:1919 length:1905 start_codon:yes stop_codon:yes gene_type:complete
MLYRPEIDGLRALAVIPVVFFHAGFILFSGGYVGVDVFFVISGYLISSIILNEKNDSKFSILNFYERRARRILPPLFFVMLICIPFAWFWMAPHQLKDFFQSLVATSLFSSNLFFFLETDYFNDFSETAPLLHTWSLAVEEQFYLFFPIIIILLWRLGMSIISLVLSFLFLASLIFCIWAAIHQPSLNFYLLPSRAWELLFGVFITIFIASKYNKIDKLKNIFSEVFGLLGFLLIIISIIFFDKNTPFPSLYTLLPVVGTGLIILFTNPKTILGKLLSNKHIVGFGLISYSLYLWHQPIFAFARIYMIDEIPVYIYFVLILLAIFFSKLSLQYIEAPFRNRANFSRKSIFIISAIFILLFSFIGYKGHINDGYLAYKVSKIDIEYRDFVIDKSKKYLEREDSFNIFLKDKSVSENFENKKGLKRVLILGDSKSEDLYASLMLNKKLYPQYDFRRIRLDNRCMESVNEYSNLDNFSFDCQKEIRFLQESDLLNQADILFLSNTWELFNNKNVFNFVSSITNKNILIMGTGNFNDLTSLSLLIAKNKITPDERPKFLYNNIRSDWRKSSLDLKKQVSLISNVHYLDKLEVFCRLDDEKCYLFSKENDPYIFDSGHVTVEGALLFGQKISEFNWLNH